MQETYQQKYYRQNKEKIKQSNSEYYKKNKEKWKDIKYRYNTLVRCARDRKISLDISKDEYISFIESNPSCYYCGLSNDGYGGGLDRLDNNESYNIKNIVSCCGECNRIKSDKYSPEQMKKIGEFLRKEIYGRV